MILKQGEMIATIKSIPWFHDLSLENIQRLLTIAEIRSIETDEVIFAEGEQNAFLFVILEGTIQIESYVPGYGQLPIYIAEPLDVIGWSSFSLVIRQNPSCARALEKSNLLAFHTKKLQKFCEINHDLGFTIMQRMVNIVASCMLNHHLKLLSLLSGDNLKS